MYNAIDAQLEFAQHKIQDKLKVLKALEMHAVLSEKMPKPNTDEALKQFNTSTRNMKRLINELDKDLERDQAFSRSLQQNLKDITSVAFEPESQDPKSLLKQAKVMKDWVALQNGTILNGDEHDHHHGEDHVHSHDSGGHHHEEHDLHAVHRHHSHRSHESHESQPVSSAANELEAAQEQLKEAREGMANYLLKDAHTRVRNLRGMLIETELRSDRLREGLVACAKKEATQLNQQSSKDTEFNRLNKQHRSTNQDAQGMLSVA